MSEKKPPEEKQTLADLEISQRQADIGSDDEDEHEVLHSDEVIKEDVGKLRRAHGLLFAISMGGVVLVLLAVGFLFINFEVKDDDGTDEIESNQLVTIEGSVFYNNDGKQAATTFVSHQDQSQTESFTPEAAGALQTYSAARNPTYQVSKDGKVIAIQETGSKTVKVYNEFGMKEAFVAQNHSSLSDWVLVPDGSRVIGLVTSGGARQILNYEVSSDTNVVGDDSFNATGLKSLSRLYYGADGAIRQYSFTGSDQITILTYSISMGAQDPQVIDSPRIPDGPRLVGQGQSPDGTLFVYEFTGNGIEALGMISLNSETVRTIYVASDGAAIEDIRWAQDSRTILVAESNIGTVARVVKLDTGPLTTEVLVDANTEGLNHSGGDVARKVTWARDSSNFAFYNGGNIWSYSLSDQSLIQLASSQPAPNAQTNYGWYLRVNGDQIESQPDLETQLEAETTTDDPVEGDSESQSEPESEAQ